MIPVALEPGYPEDTPDKALHITIAYWLDEAGESQFPDLPPHSPCRLGWACSSDPCETLNFSSSDASLHFFSLLHEAEELYSSLFQRRWECFVGG